MTERKKDFFLIMTLNKTASMKFAFIVLIAIGVFFGKLNLCSIDLIQNFMRINRKTPIEFKRNCGSSSVSSTSYFLPFLGNN